MQSFHLNCDRMRQFLRSKKEDCVYARAGEKFWPAQFGPRSRFSHVPLMYACTRTRVCMCENILFSLPLRDLIYAVDVNGKLGAFRWAKTC